MIGSCEAERGSQRVATSFTEMLAVHMMYSVDIKERKALVCPHGSEATRPPYIAGARQEPHVNDLQRAFRIRPVTIIHPT